MSGIQNQFLIEFRIDAAASATYTLPRDLRIIDAAALDEVGAVLNVTLSVQGVRPSPQQRVERGRCRAFSQTSPPPTASTRRRFRALRVMCWWRRCLRLRRRR